MAGQEAPDNQTVVAEGPSELDVLKRELEQARAESGAKDALLRDKDARLATAERARMGEAERRIVAEQDACETEMASLESEAVSLENEMARLADEPGHGKEIAAANRKMAQVEAKLSLAGQRKAWLADQRERAKAQPVETGSPRKLANGAPLSPANFSAEAIAWLEAHPKVFTDETYLNRTAAAANYAETVKGIRRDSPEFFAFVEQELGERSAVVTAPAQSGDPFSQVEHANEGEGEDLTYGVEKPQKPAAGPGAGAAVAPPSRTLATGSQTARRGAPALTADEKSAADDLYGSLPPAERYFKYAENKKIMVQRQRGHFTH